MLDTDLDAERGWRHDPRFAIGAVAVMLAFLCFGGLRCIGPCRRKERPEGFPDRDEAMTLFCRYCQHAYPVTPSDVKQVKEQGRFASKALKVPCPKCNRAESFIALTCTACGKHFAPIDDKGGAVRVCPHCNENPYKPRLKAGTKTSR